MRFPFDAQKWLPEGKIDIIKQRRGKNTSPPPSLPHKLPLGILHLERTTNSNIVCIYFSLSESHGPHLKVRSKKSIFKVLPKLGFYGFETQTPNCRLQMWRVHIPLIIRLEPWCKTEVRSFRAASANSVQDKWSWVWFFSGWVRSEPS